jgi:hypothetical protein
MKDYLLKLKSWSLVVLILVAVTAVSCSDDDDEPKSKTFFEAHGGTNWDFEDPTSDASVFVRINENQTSLFDIFVNLTGECYFEFPVEGVENTEVLEDSENRFKIKLSASESDYQILTASVSGDILTVSAEVYENGELVEDESLTFLLFASDMEVSDLDMCPMPA